MGHEPCAGCSPCAYQVGMEGWDGSRLAVPSILCLGGTFTYRFGRLQSYKGNKGMETILWGLNRRIGGGQPLKKIGHALVWVRIPGSAPFLGSKALNLLVRLVLLLEPVSICK